MKAKEEDIAKQILRILYSEKEDNTQDDKTFRQKTKDEISVRDEKYSDLLKHFVSITKWRNILKEIFKWLFYATIITAVVFLTIIEYKLFKRCFTAMNNKELIKFIPLLLTGIVSFVSTIIAIPLTITKYLFSTKEDENITQIILHTQIHDTSGRQWTLDYKKVIDNINDTKNTFEAKMNQLDNVNNQ